MNPALRSTNSSYQFRLISTLLTPSILSFSLVLIVSLLLIVIPSWSFIEGNQLLFEFFYGQYGLVSALQDTSGSSNAFNTALASLPFSYNIAVVVFSIVVSLVVFVTLRIINRLTSDVATPFLVVRRANPWYKKSVERQEEMRFVMRAMVFVVWVVHFFVTAKFVWPFSILAARTGIDDPATNWWYAVFGLLALGASIHLHVVLFRLMALRPRLIGNPSTVYR